MKICTALAWITSVLLVLSVVNMMRNRQCSYQGAAHPDHVDTTIPQLPTKVTYHKETNTLIIDDAQEWLLQSQTADVKFMDGILKIVTLGRSSLKYAPYHYFYKIINSENINNTVLIIEKDQRDPYSISVQQYNVRNWDLELHQDPTQRLWKNSFRTSHHTSFHTDSFYRNNGNDTHGHLNCFGGYVANPTEIVSTAITETMFAVWVWSMILLLVNNILHKFHC